MLCDQEIQLLYTMQNRFMNFMSSHTGIIAINVQGAERTSVYFSLWTFAFYLYGHIGSPAPTRERTERISHSPCTWNTGTLEVRARIRRT